MADDKSYFTPEQVEEQVAWLRQQPPAPQGHADERQLVQDLRRLYWKEITDERSLEAVRARLASRTAGPRGCFQRRTPSSMQPLAPVEQPGFAPGAPSRARHGQISRMAALVAVALLVVVVGGLVAALVLVSPHGLTGRSSPPLPPTLYASLNENTAVALDPTTGLVRWQHPFTDASSIRLSVRDQVVYVNQFTNGQPNKLTALWAKDGTQLWEIPPEGGFNFFFTRTLVLSDAGSDLLAWDIYTGKSRWTFHAPLGDQLAGVYSDEETHTIYATERTNIGVATYAVNSDTGKERWHVLDYGTIALVDQTLFAIHYLASSPSAFAALDASNGKERWHFQTDSASNGWFGPTVVNGVVYIAAQDQSGKGTLYALQVSTGTEHWHSAPAQDGQFSPASVLSQGTAYVSDVEGVYALNTQNGQQLWHTPSGGWVDIAEQPVVQDGLVFMGWNGNSTTNPLNLTFFLSVLDMTTGVERWHYLVAEYRPQGPGGVAAAPLVGDGVVFVTTPVDENGHYAVQALRATDGKPLWKKDMLSSMTVV